MSICPRCKKKIKHKNRQKVHGIWIHKNDCYKALMLKEQAERIKAGQIMGLISSGRKKGEELK